MRNILLSFLLLMLCGRAAEALVVEDLYAASVAVEDHSPRALEAATREALARVLVKVTGNVDAASAPELRSATRRAQDYLLQYQYQRQDDRLEVEIEFDERLLTDLVLQAGQPLWTANRPPVLVWLVLDAPEGRTFVNAEAPEGLQQYIEEAFNGRGVPLRFPLLDLQDSMQLTAQEVWDFQTVPVSQASERYGVADVLLGRLTATSSGRWLGEWMYFGQGGRSEQSVYPDSLEGFARIGADLVADAMAREFAVSSRLPVASGLRLRVDGLTRFADYRSVVDYLESVELIDSVHAEVVRADSVILRLQSQAGAEQLRRILALNRSLQSPGSALPPAGLPGADLEYQWSP